MTTMYALALVVGSFTIMELVTWIIHRYVMHGALWFLHRDHHQPTGMALQHNDLFSVIFSIPGIVLVYWGASTQWQSWHGFVGIGVALYGAAYVLVHEGLIHGRFRFLSNTRNWYLMGLKRAHGAHHKTRDREGAVCFGMLVVPLRYFKEARERTRGR